MAAGVKGEGALTVAGGVGVGENGVLGVRLVGAGEVFGAGHGHHVVDAGAAWVMLV